MAFDFSTQRPGGKFADGESGEGYPKMVGDTSMVFRLGRECHSH